MSKVKEKHLKVPEYWRTEKKFNPFYVHKHRTQIAHSIAKKIADGVYTPNLPQKMDIPKISGGTRSVTVYQIPDAAVSTLFFRQLLKKNRHRFSSFSYAYRNDRNVHFAIQDISVELSNVSRIFVAEFDFSKFFDSIDHDFLFKQFDENGFFVSEQERCVIRAFLADTKIGIPQGTSISLFLANLSCWKLDKGLEQAGLKFARYADDTVIWSPDYRKISLAYDIISNFSGEAGVDINAKKSDGISLLCRKNMPSEFTSRKEQVDFLGYSISVDYISIKKQSVNKIKRQISYILYKHLIQPLRGANLVAITIPSNNKDVHLLSAVMEIRRYLYGNLTDQIIANYLNGSSHRLFFKGIMSFYPLINNEEQLKDLDGWLITAIFKAIRIRCNMLQRWGFTPQYDFPFNVPRKDLARTFKQRRVKGKKLLQIPSFFTIYKALEKGVKEEGVENAVNPFSAQYNY
ncbi:MAG: RNA-dependent DNA polymerase [Candidatus Electrothrix sp. ATG2]|nr:RNA-dependent DNA polymerase [Candidatus Electrothrix sp. ATG2]